MAFLYGTSGAGDAAWTDTISSDTAFTARITTTDGVTSGTVRVVGGLASANLVDSAAVTNTTSATAFDVTYAIPANTLKAGSTVRVKAVVRYTAQAGATNSTLTLRIGGTTWVACAANAITAPAANDTAMFDAFLITRAAPGAAVDTVGGGTLITSEGDGSLVTTSTLANGVSLATNGALTIDITCNFSAADATAAILETLIVDVV